MRGGKIGVGRLGRGSCKKWERALKEEEDMKVRRMILKKIGAVVRKGKL